jgi:hypothetical protein
MGWWCVRSHLLTRFVQLSRGDQRQIVEIALRCLVVTVGLRCLRLKTFLPRLQHSHPRKDSHRERRVEESRGEFSALCRLATKVFRHWPTPLGCLEQSLVLYAAAQRRGLYSEVMIGLKRDDSALHAHAWVQGRGNVLSDAPGVVRDYPDVLQIL